MKLLLSVAAIAIISAIAVAKKCPPKDLGAARQAAVNRHNELRAKHKSTPPLALDDELNAQAQKCAEALARAGKMDHGLCNAHEVGQGENLAAGSGGGDSDVDFMLMSVDMWYNEIKDYDWNKPGFGYNTGHFTQVVWKSTVKLGMGFVKKGNKWYVAGRYSPPGNMNTKEEFQKNVQKLK